jgi:hypothetical protein
MNDVPILICFVICISIAIILPLTEKKAVTNKCRERD